MKLVTMDNVDHEMDCQRKKLLKFWATDDLPLILCVDLLHSMS